MIIGSLAAIFVLVWFYFTASSLGRNSINWAISGFVVYFIVALSWTYFINPGIKDAAMHSRNEALMFISRYAYIIVSLVCVVVFNLVVGKKKKVD